MYRTLNDAIFIKIFDKENRTQPGFSTRPFTTCNIITDSINDCCIVVFGSLVAYYLSPGVLFMLRCTR